MHAPLLPFYAGAAKGCGLGSRCGEGVGRRPPAAPGGGRADGARAGGARHRRACGPSACALQELSEGAPAPYTSPQKRCRSQLQPAAGPKLCREPDGRRPPAAGGGGRAGGARAGGACGPSACPLQRLPEGAPAPYTSPQKKEEPFGSPVNVIRF